LSILAQTPCWRPTLIGRPRLLIQYILSYPPYWRPFLHPQPEDAPCRGDRDPRITGPCRVTVFNSSNLGILGLNPIFCVRQDLCSVRALRQTDSPPPLKKEHPTKSLKIDLHKLIQNWNTPDGTAQKCTNCNPFTKLSILRSNILLLFIQDMNFHVELADGDLCFRVGCRRTASASLDTINV
jgi:hypothetical protein